QRTHVRVLLDDKHIQTGQIVIRHQPGAPLAVVGIRLFAPEFPAKRRGTIMVFATRFVPGEIIVTLIT
ncbi:MAG: hypothetical protein CMM61_00265, partial [Rhodospirillaceae bacterium]|nr:hypothetical protein [Rhodospirillaceae bacterium]